MIISKLILLLMSIFILVSCINTKVTKEGEYFKTINYKFFKDFKPNEEVLIDKIDNKYSVIQINKSDLSLSDFTQIDNKLKKDGWRKISAKNNFFEYCFGEKIYLGALFPEKEKYRNFAGNEVLPFNQKKWLVIMSYSEGKVNYCRNDELENIELEDL